VNHLRRELAPLSDAAWRQVEAEASRSLKQFLAGRRLVDFVGPLGWDHSAGAVRGTDVADASPVEGVQLRRRRVPSLIELRTPFSLGLADLDDIERGRDDPDLTAVTDAARRAATAEDRVIFEGWAAADIPGLRVESPHPPLTISTDYNHYPAIAARAVAVLREAGVAGPYAIALGPRCYTGVIETTEHGGYPVLEHMRLILGGEVVWAPWIDGAVVVSLRGGDFELQCGQDFAIGYERTGESTVELYIEESILPRVVEPRAAVDLRYADTAS
jgi:uncharacterized linocin/CFP29 family protein